MTAYPQTRLRRLRHKSSIRALVRETMLHTGDLVFPLFIRHGSQIKKAIASMPGQYQLSLDQLTAEVQELVKLGIKSIILFGIPAEKDPLGKDSYDDNGIIQMAIPIIRSIAPDMLILTDVCFCEYTDHGHCGVVNHKTGSHDVDNDETLTLLAKQAVSHAKAGADIIAPSGMIDGMVHTIRLALDKAGFQHLPILSYSAKYCSAMYGPFAEAAEGAAKSGDRRSLQMDIANAREAVRECSLDIAEGADMLMVKPAHTYLDVIHTIKQTYPALPLGAYHTSGEYALIKAAGANGWINERRAALEVLTAIRRAGADFIITYFAKDVAKWLAEDTHTGEI